MEKSHVEKQWHEMVQVAGLADVDPKTVRRYLKGFPVRARGAARIEKVIQANAERAEKLAKRGGGR